MFPISFFSWLPPCIIAQQLSQFVFFGTCTLSTPCYVRSPSRSHVLSKNHCVRCCCSDCRSCLQQRKASTLGNQAFKRVFFYHTSYCMLTVSDPIFRLSFLFWKAYHRLSFFRSLHVLQLPSFTVIMHYISHTLVDFLTCGLQFTRKPLRSTGVVHVCSHVANSSGSSCASVLSSSLFFNCLLLSPVT